MKYDGSTWQQVGDNFPDSGYPSIALDNNDVPYVQLTTTVLMKNVDILKYDAGSSSWVQIGTKIEKVSSTSAIAFDRNNDLHIMTDSSFYVNEPVRTCTVTSTLLKLSGNSWTEMAKEVVTYVVDSLSSMPNDTLIEYPQNIVFDNNNKCYITASSYPSGDDTAPFHCQVFTVSGNDFVRVGDPFGKNARTWADKSLIIGKDNMPMVFHNLELFAENGVYTYGVKKFNGSSWQDVGNKDFIYTRYPQPKAATARDAQIRSTPNGTLYINYTRSSTYQKHFPGRMNPHHIRELKSGRWVDIALPSGACAGAPFGIDNNGALYFHLKDHRTIIKYE